jgi:serine/threonine protein kinase
MPVKVLCPNPKCQKSLSLGDDVAGRSARCPSCGASFRVAPSTGAASGASKVRAAPAAASEPPPASDLPAAIGPYPVRQRLGQGAFGVVYKAFDPALRRDVAIKVLLPGALGSAKYVDRFLREAEVVARMHHGNIVPVYQLGQHEGGYFIASKFIPGRPLADAIPENGLEAGHAVRLVLQLLDALAYAHDQGILHRDIKPSNAMLDDKENLYLMDFGLAGLLGQSEQRMTQDGTVMGTPAYMPPEQARGAVQEVGPAADQYSAGVVLYELLTGHVPFEGGPVQALIYNVVHTAPPPPSEWRPDLDPHLEQICLQALAKDPADRFPGCREFADALKDWLAGWEPAAVSPRGRPALAGPRKSAAMVPTTSSAGKGSTMSARPTRRTVDPAVTVEPVDLPPAGGMSRRTWLIVAAVGAGIPILAAMGYLLLKGQKAPEKKDGIRP